MTDTLLVGMIITTNSSRTAPEKVDVNDKIECPDALTGKKQRKKCESKWWHEPVWEEFSKDKWTVMADIERESSKTT